MRQVHAWLRSAGIDRVALVDPSSPLLVSKATLPTIKLSERMSSIPTCEILECVALGARVELHGSITDELSSLITCLEAMDGPVLTRGLKRAAPAEVLDADSMPHARRSMLGLGESADLPNLSLPHEERLRQALRSIITTHKIDLSAFDRPGPGVHLAATNCIACGVCARSCPTGALSLTDQDTGEDRRISTLSVADGMCSGGMQCVDLCPVDALAVTAPVPWSVFIKKPVTRPLATIPTRRCTKCRTYFPVRDGSDYCPTCRDRQANPFGVNWPSHIPKPPGLAGL